MSALFFCTAQIMNELPIKSRIHAKWSTFAPQLLGQLPSHRREYVNLGAAASGAALRLPKGI